MRVTIRNRTNKRRSVKSKEELRTFTRYIVKELGLTRIKEINLTYTKQFSGYYTKDKPMHGFVKLYKNGRVRIDLTQWWDSSRIANRSAVVHELTHVKQMQQRRMVINKNENAINWNGKRTDKWKKFRFATLEAMTTTKDADAYLRKWLPWEGEVQKNLAKYVYGTRV